MGTFEKLGILVIVVIIVMILAVAIYQWGGAADEPAYGGAIAGAQPSLSVRPLDDYRPEPKPAQETDADTGRKGTEWAGGIPKTYTIQRNDKLWVIVVRRWKLPERYLAAIRNANPGLVMERLRPGTVIQVPDPTPYRKRKTANSARTYEVQVGDRLETIAKEHLGRSVRWREILPLNPGLNPKKLRPGMSIRLPAK